MLLCDSVINILIIHGVHLQLQLLAIETSRCKKSLNSEGMYCKVLLISLILSTLIGIFWLPGYANICGISTSVRLPLLSLNMYDSRPSIHLQTVMVPGVSLMY